ncbi:MAG TPA: hypothetical protein VEU08_13000, partial [Vicinamibacterales bacterium]|nr:hypothetical protein [Vicinamibacterales bacterium]
GTSSTAQPYLEMEQEARRSRVSVNPRSSSQLINPTPEICRWRGEFFAYFVAVASPRALPPMSTIPIKKSP